MINIAIVGCRDADEDKVYSYLMSLNWEGYGIITGCAKGADKAAREFASDSSVPFRVIRADWQTHGKSAGPKRNAVIVELSDMMIAFWDGHSPGTANSIKQMKDAGKQVIIVYLEDL